VKSADTQATAGTPGASAPRPSGQDPLKESAPRRTLLAAERTYLAWLRTGMGSIGVALAVGRLVPVLLGSSHLAYAWLGAGYGVLGIFLIGYALLRAKRVSDALRANADIALDWWALALATTLGLTLAVATIVMIIAEL
jgi:putative membrane protein